MNEIRNKTWIIASVKDKIKNILNVDKNVVDECALINIRRVYYLALIGIPLRIINILLFTFTGSYDTPILKMWRQRIIASHLVLLVFMIGFFLAAHILKKRREPSRAMFILQYIAVIVILASGIAFAAFDQLITTNITPFSLVCIVSGAVFLIRPQISLMIYLITYGAYYIVLDFFIVNQQVLLSNRVNGITAVGIGFLLSLIIWHYNYVNIIQRRHIETQQKQLMEMAYYDPLTGLPNRRLFHKAIKEEYSSIKYNGHESVIIILDIDNFKNINDTYGHLVGDKVLEQISGLLKENARKTDIISRFGGEEFLILMPDASLDEGYEFAERLRKIIMKRTFTVGSFNLHLTASFGVSLLDNIDNENFEHSYSLADGALYLAKSKGKNKVEKAEGMEIYGNP